VDATLGHASGFGEGMGTDPFVPHAVRPVVGLPNRQDDVGRYD
jgi:hypothetical protein